MSETESALSVPDQASFGTDFLPADGGSMPQAPAAPTIAPSRDFLGDVGYDPAARERATEGLIGARQEKMRSDTFVDRQADSRMEEDRARMDRAYRAEGAAKDSIPPPWNADKEREARVRGPMEQFGSIGSVFAMMASAFTRTPMTSALNAGAAAMQAIQQHDEKGYESAYAAWKDNTSLALKRFEAERSMFQDANTLMTSDMNAWRAKRLSIAARFEDTKALTMLQNGMDAEILEIDGKKIDAAIKMQKAKQGFEEFDLKRRIIAASNASAPKDEKPEQYVLRNLALVQSLQSGGRSAQMEMIQQKMLVDPGLFTDPNRADELKGFMQTIVTRPGAAPKPLSPEQQFTQKFYTENPDATTEEFTKAYGEFKKGQKTAPKVTEKDKTFDAVLADVQLEHPEWSLGQQRTEATKRQTAASSKQTTIDKAVSANLVDVKEEHPDWTEGQQLNEAQLRTRAASARLTPGQLRSAGVIELRSKNPGMSLDDATKKYDANVKPGASLTPESVDMNARLLIRGNPAAITNVGRGTQGEQTLAAIKNKATDILVNERKLTTEQAAELVNQNTASFMGDKRGASNLALRMSTIFGAATTALATADRVIETSEKVDRTSFSDLNKVLLSAERRTGGTEVIDFGIAVNTLVNNYARAVGGGSAALTDTARREAHELLEMSWSKGQIKSAVAQLKRELYFELEGAKEARTAWQQGTTPFPGGQVPDSTAPVIEYDNKGNRIPVKPDKRSSLDEGRVISDESPFGVEPGQQYAMEDRRDKLQGRMRGEGGGGLNRSSSTKLETDMEDHLVKNNLPPLSSAQRISNITSRIRQIEYDRRLAGRPEGEDYPPHGELLSLRARLRFLRGEK